MSDTNVHRVVGNLLVGTSHFFVDTTTNQVGINTSSPSASLDVATGDVKVGSGITLANNGTITATGGFSGDGSGLSGVNSDSGSWVKGSSSNVHLATSTDNVGIGVLDAGHKLDVNGDINISSGSTLRVGGTPAVFSNWSVNGSDIHRPSGNVGIGGAASGTNRLKVHGTVEASSFSGILATDVPTLDTSKISGLGTFATKNDGNYNIHDGWLREYGDNAHFKIYGGTRQVVFRSDGTSEYAGGIGGYPFAWMYGGDASSNRRMLLNTSGQLWCSNYGWLHSKFAPLAGSTSQDFNSKECYVQNWVRTRGNAGHYWEPSSNGNGWHIYPSGRSDMYMRTGSGNGGIAGTIGNATPRGYVHWTTSNQIGFLNSYRHWALLMDNSANCYVYGENYSYGYNNHSDTRMKKNIVHADDTTALNLIREIKPRIYEYIDTPRRGTHSVYGFIAQEIKELMPKAVTVREGTIPNIYQNATFDKEQMIITFENFDTGNLQQTKDIICMVDNDNEKHLSIKSVLNSKQLEIEDDNEYKALLKEAEITDEIFVWGQTVDDFHSIDKNYIFTVATAALQEVDRQLQTTRTELTEERTLHETTRTQLRTTQTELDVVKIKLLNIEARMQIIESNISKVVV